MGLPLFLFAAGQALNTLGQLQFDAANADAARKNAAFYREQKRLIEFSSARELDIFARKARALQGEQITTVGSRGTMINAEDMMNLAYQRTLMDQEEAAIRRKGEIEARMAELRAGQQDELAAAYGDPFRQVAQITGGLLTGYAAAKS